MADKSFTTADVSSHKDDANGFWLIVEDGVYDVTSAFFPFFSLARARGQVTAEGNERRNGLLANESAKHPEFLDEHPGGSKILKRFAGKNATKAFWKYHNESVLEKYGGKYKIGTVKEAAKL